MDCRADFQSARNDDVKVDSRDNAQSLNNSAQDSRIFGDRLKMCFVAK